MSNTINQNDKFFPKANEWMWDYCIFLGKFIDSRGCKYDLGIHLGDWETTGAIVYSNEPGDYLSGQLKNRPLTREYDEKYVETIKRAKEACYEIK